MTNVLRGVWVGGVCVGGWLFGGWGGTYVVPILKYAVGDVYRCMWGVIWLMLYGNLFNAKFMWRVDQLLGHFLNSSRRIRTFFNVSTSITANLLYSAFVDGGCLKGFFANFPTMAIFLYDLALDTAT